MSETVPNELAFLQWLIDECGCRHPRPIDGGRYACIRPMIFTHAIITGDIGDCFSVEDHWCYLTYDDAKHALDVWDGRGEPSGWIRHPASGRRVSKTGDELDENGQRVGAKGIVYVRP